VREVIFSYLDSYTGKKSLKFIPPIWWLKWLE
jgi:hypothetical protein